MNRARRYISLILFFCSCSQVLADNPVCTPSSDIDGIQLHFPPTFEKGKGWQTREDETERFKSGIWLALACEEEKCKLTRVNMKAETIRPVDDYFGCSTYQLLSWDLSALGSGARAVMLFSPDPALREGPVATWYVSQFYSPNYQFVPFWKRNPKVDVSLPVSTTTARYPNRTTVVSTRRVISEECTEQQEANQECMKRTVRIQLSEGEVTQWLTAPWKGSPETANCMLGYVAVEATFNRDYLLWVGDLDGDQRPDYLLRSDDIDVDSYTLYLSSKAGQLQLAGRAGSHWTRMPCD